MRGFCCVRENTLEFEPNSVSDSYLVLVLVLGARYFVIILCPSVRPRWG
jgi:hypothetical protein